MAITLTTLTTGVSASSAVNIATASLTPTANRVYMAFVANRTSTPFGADAAVHTCTGWGLTWTLIGLATGVSGGRSACAFVAAGTGSAGTLTFGTATGTQFYDRHNWVVIEAAGANVSAGASAVAQHDVSSASSTAVAATLTTFRAAANWTLLWSATPASNSTWTPEAGGVWGIQAAGTGIQMCLCYASANDTSPTASLAAASVWVGLGIELRDATDVDASGMVFNVFGDGGLFDGRVLA